MSHIAAPGANAAPAQRSGERWCQWRRRGGGSKPRAAYLVVGVVEAVIELSHSCRSRLVKPCEYMSFICLRIVDLPDSPAPVRYTTSQ